MSGQTMGIINVESDMTLYAIVGGNGEDTTIYEGRHQSETLNKHQDIMVVVMVVLQIAHIIQIQRNRQLG